MIIHISDVEGKEREFLREIEEKLRTEVSNGTVMEMVAVISVFSDETNEYSLDEVYVSVKNADVDIVMRIRGFVEFDKALKTGDPEPEVTVSYLEPWVAKINIKYSEPILPCISNTKRIITYYKND